MKGRHGYGPDIKLRARAMWVVGNSTDEQIAEQLGITRSGTVGEWRRAEKWDVEREIIQQETERRVSEAVAESISQMNSRHLKEFQLLQSKGVQALKSLEPKKAAEAAAMLDAGIRGERLVRGEPTEVREVRSLMQANVQVLELVVADVLKVLIESGRMDQRLARGFADEFAARVNDAPFRYAVEG